MDVAAETSLVDQDLTRINALRKEESVVRGLIYVYINVNKQLINAILNSGAAHIFLANQLVKDLGLKLSCSHTFIKAVNFKTYKIASMSYDVSIMLDQ